MFEKTLAKEKIIVRVELLVSLVIFTMASSLLFHIQLPDLFVFVLFQIFGVLIPGYAVSMMIERRMIMIERLGLAYSLGYSFNIVVYFLEELINRVVPYGIFQCVISIICVLIIAYKNCIAKSFFGTISDKRESLEILLLTTSILLLLILNIFAFACNYRDTFAIHHDMTWWINNSTALYLNYPPDNLFMSGTKLFYHYFSSIQIAYSSLATGINILDMSIPLYALTKTFVMSGATFFMLNVLEVRGWKKLIGIAIVLFTTGLENYSIVTYFHHLFLMPFGFDIGYAFGILFVSFLLLQYRKTGLDLKILFCTCLTWLVCVGAKAPIASVLILLPGALCLYWLVKKQFFIGIVYGGLILVIFILVCIYCVGMLSVANGDSASYYLSIHSFDDLRMFHGKEYPVFVAFILSWFVASPTIFVLLILSWKFIICEKINLFREKDGWFIFSLMLTYFGGIFLWRIIAADGNSEMYYGMAAFIPAYFVIGCIDKIESSLDYSLYRKKENLLKLLAVCLGVFFFLFFSYGRTGLFRSMGKSIVNLSENTVEKTFEISGLRWIRDNTEKKALIVSDSAVMTGKDDVYFYGIVSERQQYIEGVHMLRFGNPAVLNEINRRKEIVTKLYNNDFSVMGELKNDGVDYIVQTKTYTPNFKADDNCLELVKETSEINVYKVK